MFVAFSLSTCRFRLRVKWKAKALQVNLLPGDSVSRAMLAAAATMVFVVPIWVRNWGAGQMVVRGFHSVKLLPPSEST